MKKSTVVLNAENKAENKPLRTRKYGLVQLMTSPGLLEVSPKKKVNRKWSAPPCFRRKR